MQYGPALDRPNISESVVGVLTRKIVDGSLPSGERVNEVHLAKELGISRTPLREALGHLVAEGAISIVPRYGYYVAPLTLEEFTQIYQIRPILDPEALRMTGIPPAETLARLDKINKQMSAARNPEKIIDLDDRWHLELLAGCPNRILVGLIEQNIRQTRRYEMALMRERRNVSNASHEHDEITDALKAGDLKKACRALRQNMSSGFKPVAEWLAEREKADLKK